MVYAIGMRSRGGGFGGSGAPRRPGGFGGRPGTRESDEPDPGLRELAAASGGGYRELSDVETLGPAFAEVADELHRQYLLGYLAPKPMAPYITFRCALRAIRTSGPGAAIRRHEVPAPADKETGFLGTETQFLQAPTG